MAPDLSHSDSPTPVRAKYRIRFRKAGDLRLVSHHDLMHCFERMFRRAQLPFAQSQGFHPHPRMAFAQPLALGNAGAREVFEVELTQTLAAEDVRARLADHAPAGIDFLDARAIDFRTHAQVRRAFFRLPIPDQLVPELSQRCLDFLARADAWFERTRPQPRRLDLRPFVHQLYVDAGQLQLVLWISANGSARPEEVAQLLGLQDLLDAGAYFERTDLELTDEVPEAERQPLPQALLNLVPRPTQAKKIKTPKPKALMDSPLSFET